MPLSPSADTGHFDRHQSERKYFVLVLVSGKMTQAKTKRTICPQRHRRPRCQLSNLAFLQFFRAARSNLALSPYFFGLAQFDRIIELGEQTGPLQEIFKILLKMVPLCPRFFSYK